MKHNKWLYLIVAVLILTALLVGRSMKKPAQPEQTLGIQDIPPFAENAFVILNNNQPEFTADDLKKDTFEYYSDLDKLGRCGYAMACVGKELMPTEDRESISHVKPSGWKQAQYDIVNGGNLYNRCHLIGFQLTGENDNERNLITGTRYMNVEGMLPFENMIADYIKETGNHVLYRVTPVYSGDNLLATGVQMEAMSAEDNGEEICFNVFVYNSQPGVSIDFSDGSSWLEGNEKVDPNIEVTYILNISSKKFHISTCSQGTAISEKNREEYRGERQSLIDEGYVPAGCCNP